MRATLKCHTETPCQALHSFAVEIGRPEPDRLVLTYIIEGDIGALALPSYGDPDRTDDLWLHTCFEAFLQAHAPAYIELNAAPSTEWASYRFCDYRAGMVEAEDIIADRFETAARMFDANVLRSSRRTGSYRFTVSWVVPDLSDAKLNVTAVILEKTGRRSFWAVCHQPGPPDFHNPDCFVLDLPPPSGA